MKARSETVRPRNAGSSRSGSGIPPSSNRGGESPSLLTGYISCCIDAFTATFKSVDLKGLTSRMEAELSTMNRCEVVADFGETTGSRYFERAQRLTFRDKEDVNRCGGFTCKWDPKGNPPAWLRGERGVNIEAKGAGSDWFASVCFKEQADSQASRVDVAFDYTCDEETTPTDVVESWGISTLDGGRVDLRGSEWRTATIDMGSPAEVRVYRKDQRAKAIGVPWEHGPTIRVEVQFNGDVAPNVWGSLMLNGRESVLKYAEAEIYRITGFGYMLDHGTDCCPRVPQLEGDAMSSAVSAIRGHWPALLLIEENFGGVRRWAKLREREVRLAGNSHTLKTIARRKAQREAQVDSMGTKTFERELRKRLRDTD